MVRGSALFRGLALISALNLGSEAASSPREPAVAGSFYPSQPKDLRETLNTLLEQNQKSRAPLSSPLRALIVPHAGYTYSGLTAGQVYAQLRGRSYKTVILIGPYHKAHFKGASIWSNGAWRTPLGEVAINTELADKIRTAEDTLGNAPDVHLREHSLEVQIPFLQMVLPEAKIVPILINDNDSAQTLAQAIDRNWNGETLVIASTDLSHYHDQETANRMDKQCISNIRELNTTGLYSDLQSGACELCGAAAVLTLMNLASQKGWSDLDIVDYRTSGDVTGDLGNVVGYTSATLEESPALKDVQKSTLLQIAQETLNKFITTGVEPTFRITDPMLLENKAVFVTLRDRQKNLRGCIGQFDAVEPLYKAVSHMTIEAAVHDSRFQPVQVQELQDLEIEISILQPPRIVASSDDIIFKKHGVILQQGKNSGVFLPEVAESFPNKEAFLNQLCEEKANLPRDCWKDPKTQISVFTSYHF